jgi:hypothetical protein
MHTRRSWFKLLLAAPLAAVGVLAGKKLNASAPNKFSYFLSSDGILYRYWLSTAHPAIPRGIAQC